MTALALGTLLLLPFLLSLAAQGAIAKVLCAVASGLALLLSAEPYAAMLPWCVGRHGPEWRAPKKRRDGIAPVAPQLS